MKKLLLLVLLILLLVSCSQPESEPIEEQPHVYVYHAVKNGTIWVQMWIEGQDVPDTFSMIPPNGSIRMVVEKDDVCHVRIRIVEEITAIENGDYMERIEKIADSKDYDFAIEHTATTITVFRDKDGYTYAYRVFR